MTKPKTKKTRARKSKYDEPIHIEATSQGVKSLFNGKLKPQWCYLKKGLG